MTHDTAQRLLKLASAGTTLFGLAMVAALFTPMQTLYNHFLDIAHFPLDGGQRLTTNSEGLLTAISGGLLSGLGVILWLISSDLYPKAPALAGRIIVLGFAAWYLPDSLGSYLVGAWFNVVMNTSFLALFVLPVLLARRSAAVPA